MAKIIGIDLGTTNSCCAVLEGGHPVVITNAEGGRTTPSIVAFSKANEQLVGQMAKRQAVTNADNTIFSIKRFIGRRWSNTEAERSRVSYTCVNGKDDTVNVSVRDRVYTPQEISAIVLQKLKQDAENYLNEPVNEAVITVPAYFTDAQKRATKDAGEIAGLTVRRIIDEPTAAALSYGLDKQEQDQVILVFDLGGGTFDVSILQLGGQMFQVEATAGNNHLGGDDFDNAIVQWMLESFRAQEGIDLAHDKMALQRLREAAEKSKVELSSILATSINLPFITAGETGPKHLELDLTRAKFEDLVRPLIEATIEPIEQALTGAKLAADAIDRIILVGGSTRIPAVQDAISRYFDGTPIDKSVNPDEAVALGAAIQAAILDKSIDSISPIVLSVTPLSLGIETLGGIFTRIIERNTTIPTSKTETFSTAADGQTSVEIHILQGERAMVKDNLTLGKFELTGIPPAPRGVPQIEVTFEIDENNLLQVSARDKATGREQIIQTKNTGGLSPDELERMKHEADLYREQDIQKLRLIKLQNQTESLCISYKTTLHTHGDAIPAALKAQLSEGAAALKQAIANRDIDQAQKSVNDFEHLLLSVGTQLYQQAIGDDADHIAADSTATDINSAAQHNGHAESIDTAPIDAESTYSSDTTEGKFDISEDETLITDYDDETFTADYEEIE